MSQLIVNLATYSSSCSLPVLPHILPHMSSLGLITYPTLPHLDLIIYLILPHFFFSCRIFWSLPHIYRICRPWVLSFLYFKHTWWVFQLVKMIYIYSPMVEVPSLAMYISGTDYWAKINMFLAQHIFISLVEHCL